MKQTEIAVWEKGIMIFEIQERGYKRKRFVSKKHEPPSMFLARIIRTCKQWSGDAVCNYLKEEVKK